MIQYVKLVNYQKNTSLTINEMENGIIYNNLPTYTKLMRIMQWPDKIVISLLFQSQDEYLVGKTKGLQ